MERSLMWLFGGVQHLHPALDLGGVRAVLDSKPGPLKVWSLGCASVNCLLTVWGKITQTPRTGI